MKQYFQLFLAFCLSVSIFNAFGQEVVANEFKLKMQVDVPPTLAQPYEQMVKEIEEMSDGKLKISVFSAGELVSTSDVLKAVRSGIVDIGVAMPFYFSELKSGNILSGMPMTWASAEEVGVLWEQMGMQKLAEQAYGQLKVKYIGPIMQAPYAITTKKPINSLDDLKKLKIRAASGPARMFKNLGINTVYLKTEELYLALSTGQIDGVLWGGATEYVSMKFAEVSPYYCRTFVLNPITDAMFINERIWKKLPSDLKAILKQAVKNCSWNYLVNSVAGEFNAYQDTYKGKVTTLPDADIAAMTKAAQILWEEESAKDPLNKQMVDKIKNLLQAVGRLK